MANLYYREELDASAFVPGALIEVAGAEAHHAVRVSRLRAGEEILVGDGGGTVGRGQVESVAKDRFAMRLEAAWSEEAPETRLVLVQALAKGDRDERAVEQATEFGVDRIVPWQADRSVSRWDGAGPDTVAKVERGLAKWRRIAREASKQSMRARIPELRDPVTLDGLCGIAASGDGHLVVLDPRGARRISDWARAALSARGGDSAGSGGDVTLVVGPEGGFSDAELRRLEEAGAHVLVLGETVLRTSSAGPAALAVLNVALGRW